MRRVFLIGIQSLIGIGAFGLAAFQFTQTRSPAVPATAKPFVWMQVACFFLAGVVSVVLAGRHLLRLGKAYERDAE